MLRIRFNHTDLHLIISCIFNGIILDMKNTSITVYCGMLHLQYNIGNMNICRTLFQRFHFLKWAHLLWKRWKQMKKTIERIFTRKNNNEIWLLFNLRLFFNISLLSYISITYIYKFIRVSVFSLNFNLFIFLSLSLFWFYYGYFFFWICLVKQLGS